MGGTYLDEATLQAIESDLAAAHNSLAHGDLSMKGVAKLGVRALETVGPAMLLSYANARSATGELKVGPLPVDLGLGVGLALLSVFGVAGGWDDDILNIAMGSLCSWGARTGAAFGAAATPLAPATKTGEMGPVDLAGAMAPGSPVPPGTQRFMVQQLA